MLDRMFPGHEPARSVGGRPIRRALCLWYGHRWDDPLCLHWRDAGRFSFTLWRCIRCDRVAEFMGVHRDELVP